jgi:hypothetical protein
VAVNFTNYREIGKSVSDVGAGFQFEFSCTNCSRTWKSPFKPYRVGQLAGLIYKLAYFFGDRASIARASGTAANIGFTGARERALNNALELAAQRYAECKSCQSVVCEECFDQRSHLCERCNQKNVQSQRGTEDLRADGDTRAGMKCSNCSAAMTGGRFCAECGFDAASTHKSCPGCGVMCTRAARFCPECGHGF